MRRRSKFFSGRFILVLLGIVSCCPAGSPAAAEEKFRIMKVKLQLPEFPPTDAFVVETDQSQITFIPPAEAIVYSESKKREVQVTFRDDRCLITMRPGTNDPALASPGSWEQLRQVVQARYPKDEVSVGTVCFSSVASGGCGFTIERTTAYGIKVVTRLSFLPLKDGMLEVSMSAAESRFQSQQFKYNSFLNSLRISKPSAQVGPVPGTVTDNP